MDEITGDVNRTWGNRKQSSGGNRASASDALSQAEDQPDGRDAERCCDEANCENRQSIDFPD